MSPDQARALLELIADLYRVASQETPPPAAPQQNGHVADDVVMTEAPV